MSSSVAFRFNSVWTRRSRSARGASRHRFLRWRRTRPPFVVSGEFRRHRRLSLDLPASLETQTRRPREVCLPLPSPRTARPGRSRCSASRLHFPFLAALSGGVASYSDLCIEQPFFAVYSHQVSYQFAHHRQGGPVAISSLFLALVNQRQFRIPARRQFRCFDQHGLQVLVSLF